MRVSVLSAVAQPGLLSRVGGDGDDHAREESTAERRAPAARSGNDLPCVREPVCRADPQRPCDVREDVDDHEHAPDGEADHVQSKQRSAAAADDDQRDAACEER